MGAECAMGGEGKGGGCRTVVLLAVDCDVVAVEGLANQPVRRHHLARRRIWCERVSQRGKREVDLLLSRRGGLPDEARRGVDRPATGADVQRLCLFPLGYP